MNYWLTLFMGVVLFSVTGPVWGDVTIESSFKTSGVMGMGESEGLSIQRVQGQKKFESQTSRFSGAILSRLMGEGGTTTITRVDKGVSWELEPKNQTYKENPLVLPKMKAEEREGKEKKPTARISKSEFSVKKSGASENINGFPCEEYLVTWLIEVEDLESREKHQTTMTTNLWTTPETALIRKVVAEEQVFNQALAKKLGLDFSPDEAKKMGLTALGSMMKTSEEELQKGLIRVRNEMAKIKGYPIRTTVGWTMEGAKRTPKAQEDRPSASRSTERSGGIGGLMGGFLGKIIPKKTEEKGADPEGKGTPFFSTTHEVKTLSIDPVPSQTFEIPEGYVKK